jgi:hypothetical protein
MLVTFSKNKSKMRLIFFLLFCVLSIIVYSVLIEPNKIVINKQIIVDKQLERSLKDKVIVHLSDLHISSIGYREKKLIEKVKNLNPDIIFITGDFLGKIEPCLKVLKSLHANYGIWGVLGEYDYLLKQKLLIKKAKDIGVTILYNQNCRLNIDGNDIWIVGIGLDLGSIGKAFEGIPENEPVIVLCHDPNIIEPAADALTVNMADVMENIQYENNGWGWQDNAIWTNEIGEVFFEKGGSHKIRIQRREDGVGIDQIVLSASRFVSDPPPKDLIAENTTGNSDDIVILAADVKRGDIYGSWRKKRDITAAKETRIEDMPDMGYKKYYPQANPYNYFEVSFKAEEGKKYHVWLRMKANLDRKNSDSVYVQFSDSIDENGKPIYRIGESIKSVKDNANLILAGDTHGGQVRLPYIGTLLELFRRYETRYIRGLFNVRGTYLYVNSGIGTGVIPFRFLCPPEITVFKIAG